MSVFAEDPAATVFVVDDDRAVRVGLERLLKSEGFRVVTFESAQEFLLDHRADGPACMILDLRMPGQGGLELQAEMNRLGEKLPVIFLTGHGSVPQTVEAMKGGAVDFLEKPVQPDQLFEAIDLALARDQRFRQERQATAHLRIRLAALTPREQEVFELVVLGLRNKKIARQLGVTEKTVKVHRARVMTKMEAGSLPELVRFAERLGVSAETA